MKEVICGHCGNKANSVKEEDGEILLCECYFGDGK